MINVIFGERGAGKTKRILDLANEHIQTAKGSIVYIDNDNQYMFDLKNSIRFVDAGEFRINGPKAFFGFVSGIAAQDFDLECIYIDGFLKIVKHPLESLEGLFNELNDFSNRCNIKLLISITGKAEDAPEYIKPYII